MVALDQRGVAAASRFELLGGHFHAAVRARQRNIEEERDTGEEFDARQCFESVQHLKPHPVVNGIGATSTGLEEIMLSCSRSAQGGNTRHLLLAPCRLLSVHAIRTSELYFVVKRNSLMRRREVHVGGPFTTACFICSYFNQI